MAERRFRVLRARLHEAVNRHDPMGLPACGAPADEYDPEIGTVLPRLRTATSAADVERILAEEFAAWFGDLSRVVPVELAQSVWEAWRAYLDAGAAPDLSE